MGLKRFVDDEFTRRQGRAPVFADFLKTAVSDHSDIRLSVAMPGYFGAGFKPVSG